MMPQKLVIFLLLQRELKTSSQKHFEKMKDGAIICNTGHYDCEINIPDLESLKKSKRTVRNDNEEYVLKNGNRVYLLGGTLVISPPQKVILRK